MHSRFFESKRPFKLLPICIKTWKVKLSSATSIWLNTEIFPVSGSTTGILFTLPVAFTSLLIRSLRYKYYTHTTLKQKQILNKSTQLHSLNHSLGPAFFPADQLRRTLKAKASAGRQASRYAPGDTGNSGAFHDPVSQPPSNNSL